MRCTRAALPVLLAAAGVVAACVDRPPVAPGAPSTGIPTAQVAVSLLPALPLARPLASDLVTTATIGPAGGTIRLRAVGVTVVVPRGALVTPAVITVTVPAGSNAAYLFEPHGLVYLQPVRIEQDLRELAPGAIPPGAVAVAGYFADAAAARQAGRGASVAVSELRPATVDARGTRVIFSVHHFSGYMVSSGALGSPTDSAGPRRR